MPCFDYPPRHQQGSSQTPLKKTPLEDLVPFTDAFWKLPCWSIGVLLRQIDGPGGWFNQQVNQGHLFFHQNNKKDTCVLETVGFVRWLFFRDVDVSWRRPTAPQRLRPTPPRRPCAAPLRHVAQRRGRAGRQELQISETKHDMHFCDRLFLDNCQLAVAQKTGTKMEPW